MSQEFEGEAELPLDNVGARLARAREATGLTRAAIAARTKIPERHLAAIEAGDFGALPARTYAVGFSRSYAKALGLDDKAIVEDVRRELAAIEPELERRTIPSFEPGDPARVPSARFAWLAALGALVVIVAGFAFWRSYYAPGGQLPSILPTETAAPAGTVTPAPTPAPVPTGGPVVFTAETDGVWVKFYDGDGTQLLQKELALGESYTVPVTVGDVRLDTARPQALAITIGGQPVPKLADKQQTMKGVPVTAAALLARAATGGVSEPAAGASPVAASTAAPTAAPRPVRKQQHSAPAVQEAGPAPAAPQPTPSVAASAPAPAAT